MIKQLIEARINKIFNDLETLAAEVAEKEVSRKYSNKISELTVETLAPEVEAKVVALSFQLNILASVVNK